LGLSVAMQIFYTSVILILTDDVMSGPDVLLEVCIGRHVKMPLGVSVYLTPADDIAQPLLGLF